ncbi:TPA: cupin fold metalloprotein, WbuC family, partial [Aeromonas hydrophila]|nr:cupin fold metalloprotein, WbuC family [Aeromonas hydrophila]
MPDRPPGMLLCARPCLRLTMESHMKKLDVARLASLADEAAHSPRLRMNHNLHQELADPIQRLAIAMEPGTYIRPHRHLQTWELLTSLQGRFVVLNFDDEGTVIARAVLGETTSVLETPVASWHAVLSLDPGAVIFEVKHGPYAPFREEDFAPWSPAVDDVAGQQ